MGTEFERVGASLIFCIAGALLAALLHRRRRWQRISVFSILLAVAILDLYNGWLGLSSAQTIRFTVALGLPWLPWHFQLDVLSALFLILLGLVALPAMLYGFGYSRVYDAEPQRLTPLLLFTATTLFGMHMVVLANDAFAFMFGWEIMSLSGYFLVAFHHEHGEARRAAFLYLLIAHIGALAILLSFGIMAGFGDSFAFDTMRSTTLQPLWATLAFALALFGFGTKAGLVPLHLWLPEAHPVAPSFVSALMSAAVVKMAMYGFIRVVFDLLTEAHWTWGVSLLLVGAFSAIYAVLNAVIQIDVKRLLAYSTVENIGIMFIGLGLTLIYAANGLPSLAALAFIASLFHVLNHACFKGLLFLSAGAVLQSTHTTDMNRLGGLLRVMPWTGFCFLIGAIAISSLPPLNGFVSEWLLFQSALQADQLSSGVLRVLVPVAAAVLALTTALSAAAMVKAFGLTFLGLPRSPELTPREDVPWTMRIAQLFLVAMCFLLGVLPALVVRQLGTVSEHLIGRNLPSASAQGWLWLTPVSAAKASYAAPLVFFGIALALLVWFAVYLRLRQQRKQQPVPRVPPWDCGFGGLTPRMQYSAESFSMPIAQIFSAIWQRRISTEPEHPNTTPGQLRYERFRVQWIDLTWQLLYDPIARLMKSAAKRVGAIQTGHLRDYLMYSLLTLVVLLWILR